MGSTDLDCSVDILSLLNQLDLNSEMPLPSPVDSVQTPTFTPYSMTSALNGGAQPPLTVGSRRRPPLCSAFSLPESIHTPPLASATTAPQHLLSPELRFHSTPAALEEMFAAAFQMHPQYGLATPTEFGAKPQSVAAGDPSRRAFSIDDAQSFAETLRRSSAAMAHAMHQQTLPDMETNRKLSSASSSSSFDVETANSISQQLQQQQPSVRYKTELCRPFEEHGSCRYGSKCQFAHGRGELRNVSRHPKYKTEMCRTFHTTGYCPYGIRCHFIHETAVATDHPSAINSNTADMAAAVENSFCHRLAVKSSSSVDEQTHQVALQKDVERRRSTLMQMHLQQMKPSQHLNDAIPVGLDRDRRVSVSNYNQATVLPLPLEKSTSFDVVFPDVSCTSSYERIPPPPGLAIPVDVAADVVAYQRSTGSSPTSEFTSGFGSGGSSGDVSSGPGSPATALASAGFHFFQQPATYRSKQVHPTLSSNVALPMAPNESSVASASYVMNHHYMENPEVKPLLTTVFPEQNTSSSDNILQQQQLQRLSADPSVGPVWSELPDLGSSSTSWLSNDMACTVQQVRRDDIDNLQMVASLKPDELAKLIQLVKLCGTSSSPCSSVDPSVDVVASKVVVPSRQSSISGHQPVHGTGNYGATLGNAWSQTPVASYSNTNHTSPAVCW